jgi:hypothetical protein
MKDNEAINMNYAAESLLVLGMGSALVLLLLLTVAIAVGAYVHYRSIVLQREIATRRVLGARRAAIVRMFLLESTGSILVGILLGSLLVPFVVALSDASLSARNLLVGLAAVALSGAAGGWLAARHASKTPFSKSGLFRGAPDKRGEY